MGPIRRRLASDRGFSLVELAVYILVFGILMSVITAIIIMLFRSEQTVSGLTNTANDSQVLVTQLNRDIRNARSFSVQSGGTRVAASVASSGGGAITWQCVNWTVDGRKILRNGATMLQGVDETSSLPYFGIADASAVPADGTVFRGKSGTLRLNASADTSDQGTIVVTGSISNVAQGTSAAVLDCP